MMTDISGLYDVFNRCNGISTDSRNVQAGNLFFALKGANSNGNQFARDALESGAALVVVDDPNVVRNDRYILVNDSLEALQDLARFHRRQMKAHVFGITGSNGKTTTKELIAAVLSSSYNIVATRGNLNNHIGVPLTILEASLETQILVVEMGANHLGEIAFLCEIADPDCGLITSIGTAHLEGFGSPEGVRKGKGELYHYIYSRNEGCLIWNLDDPVIDDMMTGYPGVRKLSYGSSPSAEVRGIPDHSGLFLQFQWHTSSGSWPVSTHLVGRYNFANAMAAVAVGVQFGIDPLQIVKAIEDYTPSNNRSQLLDTGNNRVVVDCYNANPSSMKAAISHFADSSQPDSMLILGDMFELGSFSRAEHKMLVQWVQELGMDCLLVGDAFADINTGNPFIIFRTVAEAAQWLKENPVHGRNILLKGSRGVQLEKLLPYL